MADHTLKKLDETKSYILSKTSIKPRVGLTLGSGLSSFGEKINVESSLSYNDIPNFNPPSVSGHPGQMIFGHVGNVPVVALQGRVHYYEGHPMNEVVFPTRVLCRLGIEKLVLTNAAGGLNPEMEPGDFMIITDHINLTGNNPLIGPNIDELGPRFPDMTEVYSKEMIEKLSQILEEKSIRFSQGVYCGLSGPTYETAAEVRHLQVIGGHATGMSTVPEAIAARHMGVKICGISCITNKATGISETALSHDEVKETGQKVEKDFCDFLSQFISQL